MTYIGPDNKGKLRTNALAFLPADSVKERKKSFLTLTYDPIISNEAS